MLWAGGWFLFFPSAPVIFIHDFISEPNDTLPVVPVRVERLTLAKRLWRGVAEDGTAFGFELSRPLKPEVTVWQTASARYVIAQIPEPVLEIALDFPPCAAAGMTSTPAALSSRLRN